jgi:hypothetical protein
MASPYTARIVRLAIPPRPPHPAPNVRDDRETSLFIGHGTARNVRVIWGFDQLRHNGTTGKSGMSPEIVSSAMFAALHTNFVIPGRE